MDGTFLAIDYGARRLGMAVKEAGLSFALPLPTLTVSSREDAVTQVTEIISRHGELSVLIIGLPVGVNGQRGASVREVELFIDELNQKLRERALSVRIETVEEGFTSAEARSLLSGRPIDRARGELDAISACIILNEYCSRSQNPIG